MKKPKKPAVLTIRNARIDDVEAISRLVAKVYKDMPALTPGMLRGQIAAFPDGQFVVEFSNEIVGYAAGFRIDEATAMSPHTWTQITGGGYAARHDPLGEWLYGMEVCVAPNGAACASVSGCTMRAVTCARPRTCAASSSGAACPAWPAARPPTPTRGNTWTPSRPEN